ncbi:nodulation protein NfeD [Cupriavidus sp. DB3]|uniref:NfeD family protein n=1 Tax=Cupriavidus sp. DB3 TaxID=2873259 RepID=UPI001CF51D2A|nr:nodulation protein NfeD [Cupriavidus sp. DB3]MCA7084343.1 nodulation protein NfeD [Cupriavidus sp. DB3]
MNAQASFARRLAAVMLLIVGMTLALAQPGGPADRARAQPGGVAPVYLIPLKGAVGPASASFVRRGFEQARQAGAQLIVLEMDTPGGLDPSMRQIIQDILASPVPVLSYVYPGGARAASAGTYILYASHLAAMAPGTNLGAASPVRLGIGGPERRERAERAERPADTRPASESAASAPGRAAPDSKDDGLDTLERKQLHDAAAYIRGLAQLRGRNAEWAERAVREAVSLSADEAAAQRVVDLIAPDLPALLRAVDGRAVVAAGASRTLRTAQAGVIELEPDWRYRLLAVLTEPSVALILMMIGIYGLIFEFSTPGMVLPGVAGAICLLLALFALQMLPINYAGLALIALGIGCMVAEAFLPSFGALGLGGIVAFALGAVMLIDTDIPGFGVPLWMIGTLSLAAAALSFGVSAAAVRARRQPAVIADTRVVGNAGRIIDDGWAEVQGERWRVRSAAPLQTGQAVRVTGRQGLVLDVEPADSLSTDESPARPPPSPTSPTSPTSPQGDRP